MKLSWIPLSNKLQAIETILDSESQKKQMDRSRLISALKMVRSIQRTLVGKRYVTERSLLSFSQDYRRLSKTNYRKWKKLRVLSQNPKLLARKDG